jgi:hypothetical protein
MVCDLAMHLLRQGCYSKEGDIVILVSRLTGLEANHSALISGEAQGMTLLTTDNWPRFASGLRAR